MFTEESPIPTLVHNGTYRVGDQGCVMQWATYRLTNGNRWFWDAGFFNESIRNIAITVNDLLDAKGLEILAKDYLPRVERCRIARDPIVERRIEQRMRLWLARLVEDDEAKAFNDLTQAYLDGEIVIEVLESPSDDDVLWFSNPLRVALAARFMEENHPIGIALFCLPPGTGTLDLLDQALDAWEKIAAEEGGLGDPRPWQECQREHGF